MKNQKIFILVLCIISSQICAAYSITKHEYNIIIKMEHPSVGIVGINTVNWGDKPDDIGRDIYKKFVGFWGMWNSGGIYTVDVYWKGRDRYGNLEFDYAGSYSFSADELRKYKEYYYSKNYVDIGHLLNQMAFGRNSYPASRVQVFKREVKTPLKITMMGVLYDKSGILLGVLGLILFILEMFDMERWKIVIFAALGSIIAWYVLYQLTLSGTL